MFNLTDAEVTALMNSTDPIVAAAAKKLKEAKEKGDFIPKSRLDQEIEKAQEATKKLTEIEEARKKKEQDEALKNGEFQKLLEAEQAAHKADLEKLEQEKKTADQMRAYHKTVLEAAKAKLTKEGKWLPEYETFSLESLVKVSEIPNPIIKTADGGGKPPDSQYYTMEEIKNIPQSDMTGDVLKKVNASLAHMK